MSVMSTISFPNPHSPSHRDTPSESDSRHSHQHSHSQHINFFPATYDPQASSSSFQINPLSSHPPRTPRTSIITASVNTYPTDIYSSTEEREERPLAVSEGDEYEERSQSDEGKRVRKGEVWREVLSTSTGRDKALKLIQYSMRVYLLFHASLKNSPLGSKTGSRSSWELQVFQRLDSTMSGLSLTRKCLIMFNWLTPLTAITAPQPLPFASSSKMPEASQLKRQKPAPAPFLHTFLHAPPPVLLDLLNGLSDDIATFSRLGLIGRRIGERAANLANWCWFSGTLVGLVEVGVEQGLVKNLMDEAESRLYASSFGDGAPAPGAEAMNAADEKELERLRKQYYWLRISRAKLLMDLIFVSYECFKFKRARAPAMGISGLLSAVLSSMKLYDRHRTVLMKSLRH